VAKDTDFKAAALAALEANGTNYTRTAKDLTESGTPVSATTLRRWHAEMGDRKSAAVEARMPEARATIADRLRLFVDVALSCAPDKVTEANLRDVMTGVGIAIDKLQLLEGKPTSIDEVRDALSTVGDAAREAAATALRRRGVLN
jgi:transposase-like protein